MDAARIEVGEQGLQSEPVRAAELVARIVEARKELATGSGVELALEPVSAEVVIQADRRRLGAAIDAVLHNAIRYSPSGSQVQLRVTQTDRQVEFEIRDQGPGIPPADLQALTGASSLRGQHGSGSLRASSGPGLGLYLANNIVRAHGGQLEIHSRVGQGTTVFLRLPS
jgi:signal transduction histidine kinase